MADRKDRSLISTVCARDCYDTCSMIVTLGKSGEILSIRGDPEHPVTRGFTCPRGARDHERLYRNRVEVPCIRRGDHLDPVDWEQALDVLSRKLADVVEESGPGSVLYLDYAGNQGLLTSVFPRRLWYAIGATQTDGGLCTASGHRALSLHYGDSRGMKLLDILSADLIVFWGFNAAVSAPHIWSLAKRARGERGTRILAIDPVENRTVRGADLWVRPLPGSDVALAYGILNFLIEKDLIDVKFIREWTLGFDRLKEVAGEWTPWRVEEITGIDREGLAELGKVYGSTGRSATMIGIGLQKCDRGADQVRAVSFIPAVLGLHRGFFFSSESSFSFDGSLVSGRSLAGGTPRVVEQVALADRIGRGEFKFIYVSGMNPAISLPNQGALREGLSGHDVFVAVHETHWTETTEYADIVLPAPTFLEKEDLVMPWGHNFLRCSSEVVGPVTDSRSEVRVMREIARRLGRKEEWLYEDPWSAIVPAFEGALEDGDFRSLRSGELIALKSNRMDNYPTPSGKIEFDSSVAKAGGFHGVPEQAPPVVEQGKFILLSSSTPQFTCSQFQEIYGPIPAVILMNPGDAGRLGVGEDSIVTVSNELGRVRVKVRISSRVPAKVLWSPRQFVGLNGEPVNRLTSSRPQEIGSGPRFNSAKVIVTKR